MEEMNNSDSFLGIFEGNGRHDQVEGTCTHILRRLCSFG